MLVLKYILIIVFAYFCGNINFSIIISKLKKEDVRSLGSGNPGTMNMLRNFGIFLGVMTLLLDVLKAVIPCVVGWYILGDEFKFGADKIGLYTAGISVIIGHIYPVCLKFKGGKGVATTIGVCAVMNPLLTLISFLLGVAFLLIVKIGSLTSFLIISIPILYEGITQGIKGNLASCILVFIILALVIFAHRVNIKKLFMGKENKVILFGKNKTSKNRKTVNGEIEITAIEVDNDKSQSDSVVRDIDDKENK